MNNKLTITAIAAAMGLVWSVLPAGGAETVKDKAERTGDKIEDKAERTGDKIERKAERTGDKIERKADRTGDTVGDKIDRGVDKTKAKARAAKEKTKDAFNRGDVRNAQQALQTKGYNPGPIDGRMGPKTSAALADFQKAEGLTVTGRMDGETRQRLMASDTTTPGPAASPSTTAPGGTSSVGSPSAPAESPAKSQR